MESLGSHVQQFTPLQEMSRYTMELILDRLRLFLPEQHYKIQCRCLCRDAQKGQC